LIVACVFVAAGICLPSRLAINVSSDFTILVSGVMSHYVALTILEAKYPLKGAVWRAFRVSGLLLSPHVTIGSSPVAGVLGNTFMTLGIRYFLRLFTLSTCSFGAGVDFKLHSFIVI
jgi:hypothetical protein